MSNNDTLRIVIERHLPGTTSFHINRLLAHKDPVRFGYDNESQTVAVRNFSPVNVELPARQLAEKIYGINGIKRELDFGAVTFYPCRVVISYNRAFDENDIEFAVIEAIADVFGANLDDVWLELDDYVRSEKYKESQRISERAYARMSL